MNQQPIVVVTGATGYLSSHIIKKLLERQYFIRGTIRSLNAKENQELFNLHSEARERLELFEADLLNEQDWPKVLKGASYLLHVASPCVIEEPKNPDDIIKPAVQGVKHVLEAAIKEGIKSIVLTSSTTTVAYGVSNETPNLKYNEDNWSPDDLKDQKRAYNISKLRAEKMGWEIYERNKDKVHFSVIVPGIFLGPILVKKNSPSIDYFKMFFGGGRLPRLSFEYCDVRDVAEAHILAMENV